MDRNVFEKKMNYMLLTGNNVLSPEEQELVMQQSIQTLDSHEYRRESGYNNVVIIIEELAELQKELTKALRNKETITGILEELADVAIGVDYIKEIFDITDKEFEYAKSIKMMELKNKIIMKSEDYR